MSSDAEARVILTAKEMQRNHRWVVPTLAGEDRWEKPPLYIWAVRAASVFSEGITPLTARIPGGVSMLLLVLLGAWWAYNHTSRYPREDDPDLQPEMPALLTGLLIATNPVIFDHARAGIPESMFALLCFAALYCFGESFEMRRSFYAASSWRLWVLYGYLLTGLAMMTNGPLVFLFVLLPYVATCLAYKMRAPDWIHIPGALIASIVGGWWFLTAMAIDPSAAKVFIEEMIGKHIGAGAVSPEPASFYLELSFRSFFPWILPAAVLIYKEPRRARFGLGPSFAE
ncbi:phospholipid carrier-dependent glycosyltransferase [Candidatus Sumerlaeota bacterium]|nr:phospholipid carrier-dependent glycosyltransferase [Candidatus Sumerlaeota bacterium]